MKKLKKILSAAVLAVFAGSALASGITRDIREAANAEDSRQDGGYFELGIGAYSTNTRVFKGDDDGKQGINIVINAGYQWKGLFIDANEDDGFIFGYNALNTEHWSFDLVAGGLGPTIDEDTGDGFETLNIRKASLTAGIRATGYYDTNIFQFEVRDEVTSESRHGGYHASILAGKSWQIRNANTHIILGLHHGSEKLNDYYWGVDVDEASTQFSQYSAGASNQFTAEFGLTYPVAEDWVFRSKINYLRASSEIAKSPLRDDDNRNIYIASASISYVF